MNTKIIKNILGLILVYRLLELLNTIRSGYLEEFSIAQVMGMAFFAILYLAAIIGVLKGQKKGFVIALVLAIIHLLMALSSLNGLNIVETINLILDVVIIVSFLLFNKARENTTNVSSSGGKSEE